MPFLNLCLMVENPFFSVLIPVYNVEFFLERALLSVLNQSFSNFEIIAVNDGSTDHSSDILNRFSEKDHRLNVIHQYNQGLSASRNKAIENSRGKYLLFLDSDDELEEESLQKLYSLIQGSLPEIVAFSMKKIDENGIPCSTETDFIHPEITDPVKGEYFFQRQIDENRYFAMAPCYLYKCKFLMEYDLRFDIGYLHEDEGFTPIALCLSQSLISTRQVFYRYRIRNNSIMTSQSSLENVRGALKAVSNLLQLRKTIANSDTKKALLHRIRALVKETSNRLDSISTNSYTHLHHFLMFISIRHIPLLGGKLIFRMTMPKVYLKIKNIKHKTLPDAL